MSPSRPVLALALLAASASAQFAPWRVAGGTLVVHLDQAGLSGAGLQVLEPDQTAPAPGAVTADDAIMSFKVAEDSNLLVLVGHTGEFVAYGVLGGAAQVEGGFTLASPSTHTSVDFHAPSFHFMPAHTDGPGGAPDPDYMYVTGAQDEPGTDFIVRTPKIHFDPEGFAPWDPIDHTIPLISISAWDLVMTPEMAARLNRPELSGLILGGGELLAPAAPWPDLWSYPPGLNPWSAGGGSSGGNRAGPGTTDAGIDVKLHTLGGITEKVHDGVFPNGRQSMAMSTTACNVGTVSVPWKAAMDPAHPGIAQALYRESGDRFEQVGVAWIKHGFFATNQAQCGVCSTPGGPGNQLGVNCSDTYGTTNNSDPMWLGPRSEWNVFTATWQPCGSFFDGIPVDCKRDESGASFLGKVDHRLEAFDAELGTPGATYYYEGMYMVAGDVDKSNNVASRKCTTDWLGTIWNIASVAGDLQVQGPAINRWVADMHTQAGLAPFDGDAIVAVRAKDIGGGLFRYEYSVWNWNLDRKVRSFSVPTGGGTPTDFYFHDIDDQAANDWVPAVSGGNLTWTFPDIDLPGEKVAGALEFGTLYNFGFTCDVPPGDRNSTLGIHLPGAGGDLLAAATRAPAALNLTATKLAPAVGEAFDLVMHGGTANMMVAVVAVNGITLSQPAFIGPVPFVAGEASIPLVMPAGVEGLDFLLAGGDVTVGPLHLVKLANFITLAVQ